MSGGGPKSDLSDMPWAASMDEGESLPPIVDTEKERYHKALLQIIELGERHVDEAVGRRIQDFREAIAIAVKAIHGEPQEPSR